MITLGVDIFPLFKTDMTLDNIGKILIKIVVLQTIDVRKESCVS